MRMGYAAGPRAPEPRSGLAPWRRRSDDARLVPEDVAAGSQDGGLPSDPRRPQQPPSDGYPVLGPGTMRVGAQAEAGQSRISPGQTTGTGHRSRPRGCRPAGGGPQPPPPSRAELRHRSADLARTPPRFREPRTHPWWPTSLGESRQIQQCRCPRGPGPAPIPIWAEPRAGLRPEPPAVPERREQDSRSCGATGGRGRGRASRSAAGSHLGEP